MQNLSHWKGAITAVFTAAGAFLGWKGIMALAWVAVMALDYITGTAAALKGGQWSSTVAREGLWHKCGQIAAVIVAAISDGILGVICANMPILGSHFDWPGILLPLVLAWYILTELGSILENAILLGAHIPRWLTKLLKAGLTAVDDVGNSAAGNSADQD